MSSKYYYLIAGLPDLTLDDSKLSYTVADFKSEFYNQLSASDRKIIDLFYLKFDNKNVLALLRDKEATTDPRGNFPPDELADHIAAIKEKGKIFDKRFPTYLSTFIYDYLNPATEEPVIYEDALAALYYRHAMNCRNEFVASWFEFNLSVNNLLSAFIARKYKWEVAPHVVGDTALCEALRTSSARDFGLATEIEYFDELLKISEISELVERERKLDILKWNWMEEAIFFDYFTIERVFVFLLKLEMIERWISLDKETGDKLFRSMIDSLKNEVQIPLEFR